MKEQLVEMTQLSPRVIRVWFQNKRTTEKKKENIQFLLISKSNILFFLGCKDKKRSILAKQNQEQQKVLSSISHGMPLVASSPIPNDINIGLPPPSFVQVRLPSNGSWKTFNSYSHGHYLQVQRQNFHDITDFTSEDDSTCLDASQSSEERSDNICDSTDATQLTLL